MHPLGKGLSVAVLIFAIVGYMLMSGVMQKRGEYSSQVETLRKTLAERKSKLAIERTKTIDLQRRLKVVNGNWGRKWDAPNSSGTPEGKITLGIGEAAQLSTPDRAQNKIIHVFAKTMDASQYLGEFQLTELRAVQADAALTRPVFKTPKDKTKTEASDWPAGEYRVWDTIPSDFLVLFAEKRAERDILNENATYVDKELVVQGKHFNNAQQQLEERQNELNGNAAAPENAPEDVTAGLIVALQRTEAARNAALREVDQLRREITMKYAQLQAEISANDSRAARLPKPTSKSAVTLQ